MHGCRYPDFVEGFWIARYTSLTYIDESAFSFIESPLFTRLVAAYLTEAEYVALQQTLQANPEAGKVVVGSGGVRKLRWAAPGRGKSGGYRVIYFVKRAPRLILMLTMYAKNAKDNIPGTLLAQIRKEADDGE